MFHRAREELEVNKGKRSGMDSRPRLSPWSHTNGPERTLLEVTRIRSVVDECVRANRERSASYCYLKYLCHKEGRRRT